jgi:hypothetical protein
MTVVRLGPDHYQIWVADFGSITLVPPGVADSLYRDSGLVRSVAARDAAVEAIEGVLAEVQESGAAVSPILERSGSRRSGGCGHKSPLSSTPQTERRGTLRPSALGDGEAPGMKRQR